MSKRVLVITEGDNDEKFVKQLLRTFVGKDFKIVVFKTNIFQLFNCYDSYRSQKYGRSFGDLDVKSVICSYKRSTKEGLSKKEQEVLESEYSDIFLVFDFECQDHRFDVGKLNEFLEHFSDSSEYGRLLINYPMLESFRHMDASCVAECRFDEQFFNRTYPVEKISKNYKNDSSNQGFRWKSCQTQNQFIHVINNHAIKANYCVLNKKTLPLNFYKNLDQSFFKKLLNVQCREVTCNQQVWVINTTYMILGELYPDLFDLSRIDEWCGTSS